MPAIGTLAINDSLAVSHSFDPVTTNGNEARYADRSGGIAMGYPLIQLVQKDPVNGSRNYRMAFNIVVPKVEADAVTGQNKVTRTARFNGEFVLPEGSVLQERQDLLAFAIGLLSNALTTSVVNNFEHVY